MIDFRLGGVLLLLLPGLAAYCALYGIFGRFGADGTANRGKAQRRVFAPAPPTPSSIQSLTIIITCAVAANLAILIAVALLLPKWFARFNGKLGGAWELVMLAGAEMAMAALIFFGVTHLLRQLAMENRLPRWLYGWATDLANKLDDDSKIAIAEVLTRHDIAEKSDWSRSGVVTYVGLIADLALKSDGSIKRVTLAEAQHYLLDLRRPATMQDKTPLTTHKLLTLEADQIRSISFEIATREVPPRKDILASGLAKLYGAG